MCHWWLLLNQGAYSYRFQLLSFFSGFWYFTHIIQIRVNKTLSVMPPVQKKSNQLGLQLHTHTVHTDALKHLR